MRRSFLKPTTAVANASVSGAKCQKCLQTGHWTADCTNERVYKARPSRTALLFNPKLKLPEETLVKDDFQEPERPGRPERRKETITKQIDADEFTEQIITEAKQNVEQLEHEREQAQEQVNHYEEHRYNNPRYKKIPEQYRERERYQERRRSPSPSHRRNRPSEDRTRTRTRSQSQARSRSRSPPTRREEAPKTKEIYHYASDSDFSSDSE